MKKRIFAIILAALMVVPFGVISASADTITVPSEPSVVAGTGTYYVDWNKKGATSGEEGDGTGIDAENPVQTKDWGKNGQFATYVQGGGTVSIVGKCYVNARATMPATATPLLFTSYAAINLADIDGVNAETGAATHGSQKGMVLVCNGQSITFDGDVIFDNTVLLDRGNPSNISTYSVGSTGKMVINSNVTITCTTWTSSNGATNTGHNPILNVEEGGYAYLHAVGFSAYTGKGTLVIDEALKSEVESLLTNYEGTVVYAKAEADTTDSSATTDSTTTAGATTTDSSNTSGTTTQAPSTDNPSTGDMGVIAVVLAAFSVAIVAAVTMVTKKKEN